MPPRKAAIGSRTPPRSLRPFERLRGAFARLGRTSQPLSTSTAVPGIGEPSQGLNAPSTSTAMPEIGEPLQELNAPGTSAAVSEIGEELNAPSASAALSEIGEPFQELNAGIVDAGGDELTAGITDEEFIQFRHKCKRFRVLVIGPRNAGKTTILERLTGDSRDKAQIKSPDGEIVRHIYAFSDEKGK